MSICHFEGIKRILNACKRLKKTAAIAAPKTFPIPAIIVAITANTKSCNKGVEGKIDALVPKRYIPQKRRIEDIEIENKYTYSFFIPYISANSGLSDTAVIEYPNFVFFIIKYNTDMIIMDEIKANKSQLVITIP